MAETTNAPNGSSRCRHVLVVMGFFAIVNCFTLRFKLSVTIVAMVNLTYVREYDTAAQRLLNSSDVGSSRYHSDDQCVTADENTTDVVDDKSDGIFNWDTKTQGNILGAFFYGYITTQIISGILAQKFGGKLTMLIGVSWSAALTLLTPVLTTAGGFPAIFTIRLLEGIGQAVAYPSMATLLSAWAPPLERSRMSAFVYSGAQIGTIVTMVFSGILCQYAGWESVFYVLGGMGVIWSIMWFFLVYDTPSRHPRISDEEKNYIENALNKKVVKMKECVRIPWLSFVKCLPLYALSIAHFTYNWGLYTLLSCLPQYFEHILHFDIKSNGVATSAPYLLMLPVIIGSGAVADMLQKKEIVSTTNVRKLANSLGFIFPAVFLISTGYVNCNASLAVALIIVGVGLSGICYAGFLVNHLDLAPPYAGTLMGISNTVATLPGFIGPAVVGVLTYNNQTREAWRAVFFITAGIYAFGTIFYDIFGSGQLQPWAMSSDAPPETTTLDEEKEQKSAEIEENCTPTHIILQTDNPIEVHGDDSTV